ncbi:MAG: hypothetical protein K2X10_04635 [Hyphomicrobiales bacterium]|nr:hypothetical protein [Hyphomicrobiales bacterium]
MMTRKYLSATFLAAGLAIGPAMADDHSNFHLFGFGAPCPDCYVKQVTPALNHYVPTELSVRQPRPVVRREQARYQTIVENVLVKPERVIARHVPAVVETRHERVMTSPARREWRHQRDARGREVLCEIDVPAQYATIAHQVEVAPASVEHVTLPATYRQRTRRVLVAPARTIVQHAPAEVHTIPVLSPYAPATKRWVPSTHVDYQPRSAYSGQL